ncbi:MAG: phosphoribosylformylglycinamidine synthase subunit PurQ [Acidobacteria bacterium]|nr:phosphoribosylformylglycinamidine synthase subunit PurQ [Acidobacteriota bacterium]MBI3657324.1 phosphoribosylformylglycinamidine synthase subunit PurQ [Acidobacteriota bacterium]
MKFGVVVFPGSNCDHDTVFAIHTVTNQQAEFLWHSETDLHGCDVIILPGGFAYGDYLRTGAIAKFSPIMQAIKQFSDDGGIVLGICNGFQILQEAGLLPGSMLRNRKLKFICRQVSIRTETNDTCFTNACSKGQVLSLPIAHNEGNFYADNSTMRVLADNNQIVFRFCNEQGEITEAANVNGSLGNIAGICNERRNVLGLMPHPERACEGILGSRDGRLVFESMVNAFVPSRMGMANHQ